MNTITRIIIVVVVAGVATLAFVAKQNKVEKTAAPVESVPAPSITTAATTAKLPKLIDLGAGKCIPCKLMAPILIDLRKEYAGRMDVVFIDVWENAAAKPYGIEMIPTQIFFDADGKELSRHVGFIGKDEILSKWKELGVNLSAGTP